METTSIRAEEITHDWYIVDADNQILGRLASRVAQILRGKNKPYFTPHMDMGDFVVIINAEKVKVTGNKEADKTYFRHSGYPGGITEVNLKKVRQQHPEKIITNAVKGMLPHNRLGRKLLKHLKIYATEVHPHTAQQPQAITL
jgi:large subunit ribosomal protein L13